MDRPLGAARGAAGDGDAALVRLPRLIRGDSGDTGGPSRHGGSRLNGVKIKLADALLKTAGLAHDEARRLTESRTRYLRAAAEEINSGQGYELLLNAYSAAACVLRDGRTLHGRGIVMESLDSDLEAGVKMHPTNVLASKDVTIFEADFENPRDDPPHCPPATAQVHFQRDDLTHRVHLYFAPRPREAGRTTLDYGPR